ncbi:Basic leucine zipper and W2 domain-containing protein 1-A [Gracilariopsis chorda]|uniref:Basic leucine zipper and W2 domain-containing protein 1-A n=1 Tax=Gracilariopsis chorda TaxID=448386 RepID=A0A2V3IVR6_9FLOR|nr:Basic leucine zipper and W2 domain-containing protein 1-A [Gracilariopsis chorda]|eukprot:PXF46222.1 Basic leucine zipper and W2 domain-containing protein 1-A [Gracilariopsis chorda]
MASKELRPTLGTGIPKTRKRNIQTKLDPDSFRNRLFEQLEKHSISPDAIPVLSSEDFDYNRYGEVFCEVMIAGNIVEPGGAVRMNPTPTAHCLFSAQSPEQVLAVVDIMHQLMRRKPFLRVRYDSVLTKILSCLAVFENKSRSNLAVAVAGMLERQMLSPSVLKYLSSQSAISSGIALDFMTAIITSYLHQNNQSVDKLMMLLKSAGIDTGTMVNMMPSGSRSADDLSEHFKRLGLDKLVEQNERRVKTDNIRTLRDGIAERLGNVSNEELRQFVDSTREETALTEAETVHASWSGIVSSVNMSRKTQQNRTALLIATQKGAPLLEHVCKSGTMQVELIQRVQAYISADMELLKIPVFCHVVHLLYQKDVLSEEAILRWFNRGTRLEKGSAASSNIIREQMVPFVKWLETAEEESSDEE